MDTYLKVFVYCYLFPLLGIALAFRPSWLLNKWRQQWLTCLYLSFYYTAIISFFFHLKLISIEPQETLFTIARVPVEEFLNQFAHLLVTSSVYIFIKRKNYYAAQRYASTTRFIYLTIGLACIALGASALDSSLLPWGSIMFFMCSLISFLLCFRIIAPIFATSKCIILCSIYAMFVQTQKSKFLLTVSNFQNYNYFSIALFSVHMFQGICSVTAFEVSDFLKQNNEESAILGSLHAPSKSVRTICEEYSLDYEYTASMHLEPFLQLRLAFLCSWLLKCFHGQHSKENSRIDVRESKPKAKDNDLKNSHISSETEAQLMKGVSSMKRLDYKNASFFFTRGVFDSLLEWSNEANTTEGDRKHLHSAAHRCALLRLSSSEIPEDSFSLSEINALDSLSPNLREALLCYVFSLSTGPRHDQGRMPIKDAISHRFSIPYYFHVYRPSKSTFLLMTGFLIRVILIKYGNWHDNKSALKYTDVDYFVFTDAARYVSLGESPYMRDTYRYTPLLAIFLLPTQYGFPSWGKYMFSICDILAGWIIIKILKRKHSLDKSLLYASFWILNPLVAVISTRGNCEAILGVLSVALILLIEREHVWLAGFLLGFSVHFKIYPFIYGIAFLFYYANPFKQGPVVKKVASSVSVNQFKILIGSLLAFTLCNILMYVIYGKPFLEHTYIYHLGRTDHRHNFSAHHLSLYYESASKQKLSSFLAFFPQISLCVLIAAVYSTQTLAGTLFAQTFAFVTFNKVCTSQYFLWYLIFLPLILPKSKLISKKGLICLILWILGQALWLLNAYRLEMLGNSVFIELWLSGLFFFVANVYILKTILECL
ncbi:pig-M [Schizosaccharomyces octosporus yFS286]|uniref:GPI mannosyltransferase 1 n=1 Tax=Schizosaccharomyces octosporus (strain yFS286) TaxID=483514 RepID=S9PYD4_SCHOY|nr:pig-M [Schizosaccharomyces octosporus yFS286]EPX72463.1 pig-M [Schizosaccharomyces octosporus yFS286]